MYKLLPNRAGQAHYARGDFENDAFVVEYVAATWISPCAKLKEELEFMLLAVIANYDIKICEFDIGKVTYSEL